MDKLVIFKAIPRTPGNEIGLFSITGFTARIIYATEFDVMMQSTYLYLGKMGTDDVIVVSDDFLALESMNHDLAETMCLQQAGHPLTNSVSDGDVNVRYEMNADEFAYNNNGKNKQLLSDMYASIKKEYMKYGYSRSELMPVISQLNRRETFIKSLQ